MGSTPADVSRATQVKTLFVVGELLVPEPARVEEFTSEGYVESVLAI